MPGFFSMGLGLRPRVGVQWLEETASLIARMSTPPSPARAGLINDLIGALKQAGIWPRLDAFYMLAAHDAQAARCNWVADTYNLVVTGAPVFEANRGYTGGPGGHYLDTGFNPATMGLFSLSDAHIGVYCRTNVAEDVGDCGNLNSRIFTRTLGGRISGRMNDNAAPSVLPTTNTSVGHTLFSRHSTDGYRIDRNGEVLATTSNAASGLTSANFVLLGAGPSVSTKQVAAGHFGLSLTVAQSSAASSAIQAYFNAIGA
ncbi:hypothetical protein [Devosia chinhatensis]|uniref:Uncharacterized protein n=1 Tax=Devosia chinhatensis TaxID=429727 RepID=A0A0F5FLN1_9HYPH|nr:hypothetical protein [Devosia chinhatensis]KKB09804.1 hypothetical protein VE26_08100 [Devosia chinhatensis]